MDKERMYRLLGEVIEKYDVGIGRPVVEGEVEKDFILRYGWTLGVLILSDADIEALRQGKALTSEALDGHVVVFLDNDYQE